MSSVIANAKPTPEQIEKIRGILVAEKLKIRTGGKHTINTKTMTITAWYTVEVWCRKSRKYLPLAIGESCLFERREDRDEIFAALGGKLK